MPLPAKNIRKRWKILNLTGVWVSRPWRRKKKKEDPWSRRADTDQTFTCSLCGQICLSCIGLVSHAANQETSCTEHVLPKSAFTKLCQRRRDRERDRETERDRERETERERERERGDFHRNWSEFRFKLVWILCQLLHELAYLMKEYCHNNAKAHYITMEFI